ncbi:MAG: histidine triad nucleotide-binding protein [Ruminococcus sp.]|jgi:histidine triad (HIT) family protein|nr:histidine triad nucleotide-binding protein [Ruminococcus sp.]
MDCLFCKIINGQIPSDIVFEDESIMAFRDIAPQAPVHVLVIPKTHLSGMNDITDDNKEIAGLIFSKIPEIAKITGISESGYRVVSNCGSDACQSVNHLHFHILGGKKLSEKMA